MGRWEDFDDRFMEVCGQDKELCWRLLELFSSKVNQISIEIGELEAQRPEGLTIEEVRSYLDKRLTELMRDYATPAQIEVIVNDLELFFKDRWIED